MDKQKREQALNEVRELGAIPRLKEELTKLILKLSSAIQKSHSEGKIPADYSLGFANGLILFEHKLNQRDGGPTFFDRTTSIGALPMPVALRTPGEVEKEFNGVAEVAKLQEERYYEGQIVTQARGVVQAMEDIKAYEENNPEREDPNLVAAFSRGLAGVRKSIMEFDEMMTKREEALHAQRKSQQVEATANEEDAPGEPQGLRIAQPESGSESQ